MKNMIKVSVLSFFLLLSSNAFALQGKEAAFIEKIEKGLEETQLVVQEELASATDEELLEKYGDVLLEAIFADSPIVETTGISIDNDIRTNVELLFSDKAKNFLVSNVKEKLEDAGSIKAFKKEAKKVEKNLKKKHKGLGRVLVVIVSYITAPFFFIFGPWGWVYWSVLFGYWS